MLRLMVFTALLWSSLAFAQERVLYEFSECESSDCPINKKMSKFERIPGTNSMASVAVSRVDVNGQLVEINQLALLDEPNGRISKWVKLSSGSEYKIKGDPRWNFILLVESTLCEGAHSEDCSINTRKVKYHVISHRNFEPRPIGEFNERAVVRQGTGDNIHFFETVDDSLITVTTFDRKNFRITKKHTHEIQGNVIRRIQYFSNTFQYVSQSSQKTNNDFEELRIVDSETGETKILRPDSFDETGYRLVSDEFVLKVYRKRNGIFYSVLNLLANTESELVLVDGDPKADIDVNCSKADETMLVVSKSWSEKPEWTTQVFGLDIKRPLLSFKEKPWQYYVNEDKGLFCTLDRLDDGSEVFCHRLYSEEAGFELKGLATRTRVYSHYLISNDIGKDEIKIFDLDQKGKEVLTLNSVSIRDFWIENTTFYSYQETDDKNIYKSYKLK